MKEENEASGKSQAGNMCIYVYIYICPSALLAIATRHIGKRGTVYVLCTILGCLVVLFLAVDMNRVRKRYKTVMDCLGPYAQAFFVSPMLLY